jgi:hypothetical protein
MKNPGTIAVTIDSGSVLVYAVVNPGAVTAVLGLDGSYDVCASGGRCHFRVAPFLALVKELQFYS